MIQGMFFLAIFLIFLIIVTGLMYYMWFAGECYFIF